MNICPLLSGIPGKGFCELGHFVTWRYPGAIRDVFILLKVDVAAGHICGVQKKTVMLSKKFWKAEGLQGEGGGWFVLLKDTRLREVS